jgi:RNA polymerase sigma-70 factor (ECF subfamily)
VPEAQRAEVIGLLALMLLHHSRRAARLGAHGELILLESQDRNMWDRRLIRDGLALLETALHMRHPGPYQIQAAISALHARAARFEDTDWPQIVTLYGELRRYLETAVIRLNQAVAVSMAGSPQTGLRLLALLGDELAEYGPYHLARADMLRRCGDVEAAREAYRAALELTHNKVEREFIQQRMEGLGAA